MIIDDEILAITLLENLIKGVQGVEIIGKYTNFEDGLDKIKQQRPDLVFLDIEMPGENGIRVAEWIKELDEEIDIIFVTAYDHYALEAFGVHAVDYLLKPVDQERLRKSLMKLIKRKGLYLQPLKDSELMLGAQFLGNFVLYNTKGQPVKWRTRKVKELCAYLLHHNQLSVHKDQILEELWPELSINKAKSLLHTSMYQLRKELKNQGFTDAILYTDERYKFNMEVTSDSLQLMELLENPSCEKEELNNIIALYKHDYLNEDQYIWSFGTSNNIRKKVKAYLEHVYKLHPSREILEKLIDLEPLEESYRQLLISSYIHEGRLADALDIFEEFEKLLWEETNEKPSSETKKLVMEYI